MHGQFPGQRLAATVRIFISAVAIALCLQPVSGWACKYSVRDVGFVDLGSQPYRLYCFLDGAAHADFRRQFLKAASQRFADGNVVAEVIDVTKDVNHPALQFRPDEADSRLPALVLAAPNAELPPLSLQTDAAAIDDQLQRIVASTLRDAIMNAIVNAYAVVVVVEGKSPAENRRAAAAAGFAIKQLNGIKAKLDKPVDTPPKLLTISAEDALREEVLLWSWGLDAEGRTEPSVVTLFGRGRRLGPVVTGADISGTELFDTLALVGKSCECELDRSWMQGPMFPHSWDANRQADVVRALGFDAENPLIKVEISRIIARGADNRAAKKTLEDVAIDPLLGYGEFDVDELPPDNDPVLSPPSAEIEEVSVSAAEAPAEFAHVQASAPAPTTVTASAEESPEVPPSAIVGNAAAITVGALCAFALGGGLFLLFRRRGQA